MGANCRRGEQTNAMGRLKLGPMCPGGSGGEGDEEHTHTLDTRFTQVRGPREEVTPLLLLVYDV